MSKLPLDHIDPEALQQFGNLELLAKQVVEGFITGLHNSPFHGFSVEFAEHRLYNTGESTRHIDWKLYGRTDRLYTKRYEEETNLRCQILMDTSSSMQFPDANYNKLQFSIYAAASIIYQLRKQRDAAGLTLFSDKIEAFHQPKSNAVHNRLLFSELEGRLKQNTENKKTATTETLHMIAEAIHKRSLVVLFSDMFDSSAGEEDLFQALQHLKYNKHEVIVFHTLDSQKEMLLDYPNRPYEFVDVESGESVKLFPDEVKEAYREKVEGFRKRFKLRCQQYKIDYVEADIQKGFRQVLLPYFVKRSKMM